MATTSVQRPRWQAIPVRVLLFTALFTLLTFAIALLLSIVGSVIYAWIRHVPPPLQFAYRHIALPFAIGAGSIAFFLFLFMEIRHYRRSRALAGIERVSGECRPRIAIPVPHGEDREYAARAIVQYEKAVKFAGGEPVRIELDQAPDVIVRQVESCAGVLLPGSKADINPQKYGAERHPKTNPDDPKRDAVDRLLLDHVYQAHKPVLAICYGLQSLNVYCGGTLVQHIESEINHTPGRTVQDAHAAEVEPGSKLADIVGTDRTTSAIRVTSSHHQSADRVGKSLRVVARSPMDQVIEALEGTLPDHFVVAVQWHPERSVKESNAEVAEPAKKIFRAFIEASRAGRTRNERSEVAGG